MRLDAPPDAGWAAAFDQERDASAVPFVRHGRHLLCTSTAEASRRLGKAARRLVGATNGRVGGAADPEVLAS